MTYLNYITTIQQISAENDSNKPTLSQHGCSFVADQNKTIQAIKIVSICSLPGNKEYFELLVLKIAKLKD
jgi:hypothetical protein